MPAHWPTLPPAPPPGPALSVFIVGTRRRAEAHCVLMCGGEVCHRLVSARRRGVLPDSTRLGTVCWRDAPPVRRLDRQNAVGSVIYLPRMIRRVTAGVKTW